MPLRPDLHEINRASWNEATRAHNSHKKDQAAFLKQGGSTVFPEELALLGDLTGKSLLHLLCNSGQDTLSLAHRGATVTGVDISDEAIAFATGLSQESGIPGTFHRADAYDFLDGAKQRGESWDVAFCSYGALCWLSDLERFAHAVADCLAPGGRFVTVEFHPALMIFDESWKLHYPYFSDAPLTWDEGISDYVGASGAGLAPSGFQPGEENFRNPHPSHEFLWGIGEIVSAFLNAGLILETLREYPYANGWNSFERMVEGEGRRFYPPPEIPSLPMMVGLAARK